MRAIIPTKVFLSHLPYVIVTRNFKVLHTIRQQNPNSYPIATNGIGIVVNLVILDSN